MHQPPSLLRTSNKIFFVPVLSPGTLAGPPALVSWPRCTLPESLDLRLARYEFRLTKITPWRVGTFLIESDETRTAEVTPGFLQLVAVGSFVFHPNPESWPRLRLEQRPTWAPHTPLPGLGLYLTFQVFAVSSRQLKIPAAITTYFQLPTSSFVCQTLSCYR